MLFVLVLFSRDETHHVVEFVNGFLHLAANHGAEHDGNFYVNVAGELGNSVFVANVNR
jgi:hypothetical protein